MLKIQNYKAFELLEYVRTEEGKDVVENLIYGNPIPNSISKHSISDVQHFSKMIDLHCKKVCGQQPSKNVLKQLAIDKFILEKKEQLKLSWEQTHRVWNNVMIGLILKTIHSKDFVWKDGKIESIAGFDFFNETCISNDTGFI